MINNNNVVLFLLYLKTDSHEDAYIYINIYIYIYINNNNVVFKDYIFFQGT